MKKPIPFEFDAENQYVILNNQAGIVITQELRHTETNAWVRKRLKTTSYGSLKYISHRPYKLQDLNCTIRLEYLITVCLMHCS